MIHKIFLYVLDINVDGSGIGIIWNGNTKYRFLHLFMACICGF